MATTRERINELLKNLGAGGGITPTQPGFIGRPPAGLFSTAPNLIPRDKNAPTELEDTATDILGKILAGQVPNVANVGSGVINRDIITQAIEGLQPDGSVRLGAGSQGVAPDPTDLSGVIGETPNVIDIGPGVLNTDIIDDALQNLPIFTQPDGSARPGAGNQGVTSGQRTGGNTKLEEIDLGKLPGRVGGEGRINLEDLGNILQLSGDVTNFAQNVSGGGSNVANGTRTTRTRAGEILNPFGLRLNTGTANLLGTVTPEDEIDIGLTGFTGPAALRNRFVTGAEDLLSRTQQRSQLGERLLGDFVGGTRDLLGRFRDNREGFIASQINPLIRQLQRVPRETERDFARRGIAGSLPAGVVSRQEQDVGRAIAEARAQAEAQAVGIERDLLDNFMAARKSRLAERAQNLGLEGQTLDRFLRASQSALQEELGKLGLSAEAARIIAGSRQVVGQDTETEFDEDFDFGGALGGLGALLTGIGNL